MKKLRFVSFSAGFYVLVASVLFGLCQAPVFAQSLSANSGINANDTYIVFDLSAQESHTQNLSGSIWNTQTNSYTQQLNTSSNLTFHIEAGYDTNGNIVANIQPTGATETNLGISMMRYANGTLTLFDMQGNPLPNQPPAFNNAQYFTPATILGANPGPSVISGIIVPNLSVYAQQNQATITNQTAKYQTQCNGCSAAYEYGYGHARQSRRSGAIYLLSGQFRKCTESGHAHAKYIQRF